MAALMPAVMAFADERGLRFELGCQCIVGAPGAQQRLYLRPLPHGHSSLRPIFRPSRRRGAGREALARRRTGCSCRSTSWIVKICLEVSIEIRLSSTWAAFHGSFTDPKRRYRRRNRCRHRSRSPRDPLPLHRRRVSKRAVAPPVPRCPAPNARRKNGRPPLDLSGLLPGSQTGLSSPNPQRA